MADIYFNIAQRTGGEIYAGIVGPVRTGKSTFIKRFMELFVVPAMEDGYAKNRVVDQLPQSGNGRTITTTEPLSESAYILFNDGSIDSTVYTPS